MICTTRMRRLLYGLLAAAGIGTAGAQTRPPAGACPPVASAPSAAALQAAQEAAVDRGFLWRITKDGISSHLFGTLHLGRLEWAVPGPRLREALNEAAVIALELDLTDSNTLQQLQAGMATPPGEPPLPAALQQQLARETAAACLPAGALDAQHPVLRAVTLSVLAARWDGLDAGFSQEAVIAGYAQGMNLPIVALERVATQLDALLPKTPAERQRSLEQALNQLQSGATRRSVRRLSQAWADSRLDQLEGYERWCECITSDADRQMLRRLNDDRNPGLADAITRLHAQGRPVLAAVGAMHMIGAQALPRLLAERGFTVERLVGGP